MTGSYTYSLAPGEDQWKPEDTEIVVIPEKRKPIMNHDRIFEAFIGVFLILAGVGLLLMFAVALKMYLMVLVG